ncbi:phage tail tube protein [Burkholderia gladioli]|uniref:phage tail tube protein n=1 Tax=Burkholderia gladioli TaxID=28095 RepID=UPI00163F0A6A|nr:phage tail tube protein [Burkholderia gladioli]
MPSTAISAQGTKISKNTGTTAAPVWTQIVNVSQFTGFSGSAADIDVTDLSSTGKEYRPGLQDWDSVTMDININLAEPSHAKLLADKKSGAMGDYKAELSDGSEIEFSGYVKSFPITMAVDGVYKGSVVLKISGDITVTPAAGA